MVKDGLLADLHARQAFIQPIPRHQFDVRAFLDDALAFQDDDLVGVADGGEPVGNDDGRAARHQPFQRLLDEQFGFGIHRGGGLVQDQDRAVFQDRARDRKALLLPAGELDAALADQRIVAVGEPVNELVGVGGLGRR